ncbi:MAG: hypothetical protein WBD67_08370 [Terracidiphilus sp.]
MLNIVRQGLVVSLDSVLVDELLAAYQEAKRNFYLGGLRLSAVEGGRFCEAAFRLLQQRTTGKFDPLGKQVDSDGLIKLLANIPAAQQPESVRLHIPRALRVVYDIRNKRDNAHLADGIDPNLQDASLVVAILDWVVAEFVRLYHSVTPNEARIMVENIVTRKAPAVEDFDGFLKVLRTDLGASDFVLLLLYQRGQQGATFAEIESWIRPKMRSNLRRTLTSLEHAKAYIHGKNGSFQITRSGQQHVEASRLLEVAKT